MCDISKKTNFKTKTVYKAVEKHCGKYYSYFAMKELQVGKVEPLTKEELDNLHVGDACPAYVYLDTDSSFYNPHMVERVSGFALKEDAQVLADRFVLKIVLGGDIMKGTARRICGPMIPEHHIVYAGTKILSMKEV